MEEPPPQAQQRRFPHFILSFPCSRVAEQRWETEKNASFLQLAGGLAEGWGERARKGAADCLHGMSSSCLCPVPAVTTFRALSKSSFRSSAPCCRRRGERVAELGRARGTPTSPRRPYVIEPLPCAHHGLSFWHLWLGSRHGEWPAANRAAPAPVAPALSPPTPPPAPPHSLWQVPPGL